MKKFLFAAMAAILFVSCSQDDMANGQYENESDIKVSVKEFEYDGDGTSKAAVRSALAKDKKKVALKFDGTALKFSWQYGDKVGMFGSTDKQQVGLKMKDINSENNLSATFDSNDFRLEGGKNYMAYYPMINDVWLEPIIPVDYTGQTQTENNSTEHLGAKDYIMSPWTEAVGENNISFTFQHISAVLWLNIKMPDNTTAYKSVTLSAKDAAFTTSAKIQLEDVKMALDGKRQYISPECITDKKMADAVTLNFNGTVTADANNMLNAWMMVLPADFTNREMTVIVTPVEGAPIVYTINPGKNFLSGKAYKLTVENIDNDNPEDTGNWPDEDIELEPGYITNNTPTWVSDADGWTVNVDNYGDGGWGTYVTYTSNGMMNGLLTSKGGSAFYYQWGRWLGFPSTCGRTIINSRGSASGYYPNASQYLNGVNIYNTNYGYIFDSGLVCSYAACWMGNSSWTRTRALNSSIIFGMVSGVTVNPLDYIGANESCKWEDRCGNPAPDGYRIPTATELEAFIPAAKTINSSLKELKVIKGIKYAMYWKVVTSGSVPYVEIRSVKVANPITDANTVADATFDAANPVRFAAYGFIDNEAGLQQRGSYGVYWSSDTGINTLSGTRGYGGKCLEIDFSGSKATMGMTVAPRCFGIPVLLIKDSNAKATPVTPWFPLR